MLKHLKILIIILLLILAAFLVFYFSQRSPKTTKIKINKNLISTMQILSPAFQNNQNIPPKYTCDGEDINPPLEIKETPEGTKSLALIVDDPDAPMGTFVHWVVWNIPPSVSLITENSVPQGAMEGATDFGRNSYGGPCPPSGAHRYYFKLYALDQSLELASNTTKEDLLKAMEGHIIDQAELIGLYERQ